ncbi:tetraspanin-8 [Sphaerodactylus townsendi]|uniref:tetraspanin-8 n=1 Tax=Sphaerodactylus townsendi TaxID=933632 RepID=UPI00202650FD|nr:tetraspanin-8 [Sphaerodactylus townsendi]XP_048357835.1 tetraspanin-8 [Sphaerodactylus townsendi]
MAGVSSCMKYSMFIFNFIFWVCGCIILGVSIWLRVSKSAQEELNIDDSFFSGIYLLIAVGSIIMVLGFLGCCGAIKESQCMLLLFFIGLLLILLLQIVAGILGAVYQSKAESAMSNSFQGIVDQLKTNITFQQKFREFEKKNKCCGLGNGEKDWDSSASVKDGCLCLKEDEGGSDCSSTGKKIYTKSCRDVIVDFFKSHMVILMGIAFGFAFIEIFGLVFSMSLYCQIQRK